MGEGAAGGGCVLDEHQEQLAARLTELLRVHNARLNLVAPGDIPRLKERHIDDSLAALAVAEFEGRTIVDIGSGAGLPGLPLAIAVPAATFVCVERIRKKAAFIKLAAAELGLRNVRVEWADSGDLLRNPRYQHATDLVTIRAVADTRKALALAEGFLKNGGCVLLWQTREQQERESLPAGWTGDWFPGAVETTQSRGIRKVRVRA